MHKFSLAKGFDDITILYCEKCGLSFHLFQDKEGGIQWVHMKTMGTHGEPLETVTCEALALTQERDAWLQKKT